MPVAAAIIGGVGAIGGGILQGQASQNAADTQAQAARDASAAQLQAAREGIQAQATATAPWRGVGSQALYRLADLLGIDARQAFPGMQGGQRQGQQTGVQSMGYPATSSGSNGVTAPSKSLFSNLRDATIGLSTGGVSTTGNAVRDISNGQSPWTAVRDNGLQLADPANAGGKIMDAVSPDQASLDPITGINGASLIPELPMPGAPDDQFGSLNRRFSLADFEKDPGYEFRRTEGQRGVENSAAARGMQLSGANLKGVDRFNQDYASNEYGTARDRYVQDQTNDYNRLASIAGLGQTSAENTGSTAASLIGNYGSQVGQNITGAGNAIAAGQVGSANAINGGLNNALNNATQQYYLDQLFNNQSGG